MTELNKLSLKDALHHLKSKKCSAVELTEAHISAMEKQKKLNVFITETTELARAQAKNADARYLRGDARGLEGIPVAIKDVFCTKDVRTTNASKILSNFIPPYESTVTAKLFDEGAIMLGKTNMDEFAMGSANNNSAFGQAISPWKEDGKDEDLVPGGSSGGSAAAVAARMSMAALGSDTGGSVRQPAAYCGIVGFKPTYGRCSRFGIIAYASSLDQAAIFARSVEDTAEISKAIMGYDNKDSTCVDMPLPDFQAALTQGIKGMKIGIPKQYHHESLDPEIEKLWMEAKGMLQREGAEIIEVDLPHTKYGVAAYYVIAPAEASSNLARYDGVRYGLRVHEEGMTLDEMYEITRKEGFGHEVEKRIMIGTYVLSSGFYDAYFAKAQRVRRLMVKDFKDAFAKVDALLTPTTTNYAFPVGDKKRMDPIALYLNDMFTIPASMAGLPCVSIPGKLNSKGLPIGLQVIASNFREDLMFRVARNLERCFNFDAAPGSI